MRINRYIAKSTGYSRRFSEKIIAEGRVKINHRALTNLATNVEDNDLVTIDDKPISPIVHVYYALNKPIGYTSTRSDPFAAKKVVDLVPLKPPVFPVGRLDRESEGLIILTNDGDFSYQITHPSTHVEKEYYIEARTLRVNWDIGNLHALKRPMRIDRDHVKGGVISNWRFIKAENKILFNIIIEEGRKRQIRRMCDKIGLKVEILKRVRIGSLKLGHLETGQYRIITPDEVLPIKSRQESN